jgi:hypothetical protein
MIERGVAEYIRCGGPQVAKTLRALTRGVILKPRRRDSNNPSEGTREVARIGKTGLHACS